MTGKAFNRYRYLLALVLALVGVGVITHYAQHPYHHDTTYQTRADVPASHHTYPGALQAGQKAVFFALEDNQGKIFDLEQALEKGPVVLTFFRGNWCPLCAAHLKKLEAMKPAANQLGAQLVAISAQTPEKTARTQEKFGISFPVLSDKNMQVTKAYGVAWQIPPKDRQGFATWLDKSTGQSLNDYQDIRQVTDKFTLPVPATYVIAPNGDIVYAHVDENYQNRAEPGTVLDALKALK